MAKTGEDSTEVAQRKETRALQYREAKKTEDVDVFILSNITSNKFAEACHIAASIFSKR